MTVVQREYESEPRRSSAKALAIRPKQIDEFRNLDQERFGRCFCRSGRDPAAIGQAFLWQWIDDPATICPPQGETVESAMGRIRAAFRPLLKRHHDEPIGLVVG